MTIVGEYKMHISHVLAALPGQSIEDLKEVNSHPMALMQCAQFLQRYPNLKVVEKMIRQAAHLKFQKRNLWDMQPYVENMPHNCTV